jgi:predicted DNA-binding transcriptional regulator YafY
VSASRLADELGVSPRTIYRDIATLVSQGAPIVGEAGLGYVLQPGYFLPPLMFGEEEVDALILGLRLVGGRGDPALGRAAADALAKIIAVLPPEMEDAARVSGLLVAGAAAVASPHLDTIRQAIRAERKLRLGYTDASGAVSERTVWPVALGFFEGSELLAAWCEMRQDYRHFRLDRITAAEPTEARYAKRRRLMLAEWRLLEGIGSG